MQTIVTSNAVAIFFDPLLMRAKDETSKERLLSTREAGFHVQRMAYAEMVQCGYRYEQAEMYSSYDMKCDVDRAINALDTNWI